MRHLGSAGCFVVRAVIEALPSKALTKGNYFIQTKLYMFWVLFEEPRLLIDDNLNLVTSDKIFHCY